MLTDSEIREALDQHVLKINPFEPKNVEPASYDVRAGRILVARRGIVDLSREAVVLRHGDWAEIESLEVVELPLNIAGTVGVRSSLTRRGLDWFSGPQIDPGYMGKIYISVFNASVAPIDITYAMPFATLTFYRLAKNASRSYDGKFQKQLTFPEEDVERMLKMESYTLSDVITSVGLLEKTVNKLTETSERMATDLGWVKKLLFAILIALMIGVGSQLISHWIK
jgi:dCTP deaminase